MGKWSAATRRKFAETMARKKQEGATPAPPGAPVDGQAPPLDKAHQLVELVDHLTLPELLALGDDSAVRDRLRRNLSGLLQMLGQREA